jgi:hypothetical protein
MLASVLDAPVWFVPVFFAPLPIYLHFRAEPRGQGFRWFLAISFFIFFMVAAHKLLPASLRHSLGPILFFASVVVWSRRRSLKRRVDVTG